MPLNIPLTQTINWTWRAFTRCVSAFAKWKKSVQHQTKTPAMKQKTNIGDLRPGMYVTELDRPWLETPFVFQGFFIHDQSEIDELARHCQYVYVDPDIREDQSPGAGQGAPGPAPSSAASQRQRVELPVERREYHIQTPFEQEFKRAWDISERARELVYNMYSDVRSGESFTGQEARKVVHEMVASVVRNPDAQLWMAQLGKRHEESAEHSLAVCILSLVFARHLGLEQSAMAELGLGALLHDVGKTRVDDEVMKKVGHFTDEDRREMQRHAVYGHEILSKIPDLPPMVAQIAWCHHEKPDGTGYPRGLKRHETPLFARIVELVDSYEAMTGNRSWRKQMSPYQALSQMYNWRGERYDNELVEQFIQCLGIYPVGSLVELVTGEVAIVMASARSRRLLPKVLLVLDRNKKPFPRPKVLDMKVHFSKTRDPNMKLKTVLPPGAHDIRLRDYIRLDEWFVS